MLRHVHLETTMFGPGDSEEKTRKDLCWWLEALTQRDQDYLSQRPDTPRLYKSGVRYAVPLQYGGEVEEVRILRAALGAAAQRNEVARVLEKIQDVFGGEHFCDIGVIRELGGIDCDGIAAWRTAELRQKGIRARPYMTNRKTSDGGTIFHALVLWPPIPTVPYVTSEDPSLLLGMGGAARVRERAEEIRKNAERTEILKKYGLNGKASSNGNGGEIEVLEGALGLQRAARPAAPALADALASIDHFLRSAS